MKKFTLFFALLIAMTTTAMAQSYSLTETRLSSSELNSKTESTLIAIKNLSATNNYYYVGNTGAIPYSKATFDNDAVFVWEPLVEGTPGMYCLKKLDGTYMTTASPVTFSTDKNAAAIFSTTNPTTTGSGSTKFNGDTDTTFDDAALLVRFVTGSNWINVQNGNDGTPKYNTGEGGWTVHNVYVVEETQDPEEGEEGEAEVAPVLSLTANQIGTTYPYELNAEDAANVFALTDLTVAVRINTPASLSGRKALFATADPTKAANTDAMGTNSYYVAYGLNNANAAYLASWVIGDRFSAGNIATSTNDVIVTYVINPTANTYGMYANGSKLDSWENVNPDGFMNGYEIATPAMVKADYADAKIYIGGAVNSSGNGEVFGGTITGVKVYDGALTAEEIAAITFEDPVVEPLTVTMAPEGTFTTIWGDGDISFTFNKAVAYNAPADGLKIMDSENVAVSNVTSFILSADATTAKMLLDKSIDKTGTYTLTFPEGTFTSTDGAVLEETTFTFNVENTPVVEPVTATAVPAETVPALYGDGSDLKITFSKPVTYNAPADGLKIMNSENIAVSNVTDVRFNTTSTVAFIMIDNQPINQTGTYTLTIPEGVFNSEDGATLAETTFTFKVEAVVPEPSWWTDYDYTKTAKKFDKLTVGFDNTDNVNINGGVAPVLYISGSDYEGTAEVVEVVDEKEGTKSTKIEITFGQEFTDEGEYQLYIPAGLFTMNGDVNNEEKTLTFTVVAPVEVTPLDVSSVTPKFGENGQLEEIEIVYNQAVYMGNPDNYWSAYPVYLTNENGDKFGMWQKDPYDPNTWTQVIPYTTVVLIPVKLNDSGIPYEYNDYYQVLGSPITTIGTYTFNLADITVRYGKDEQGEWNASGSIEGTYTFSVTGETAIEGVDAEAENAVIYDLTGRRVEKITNAGIYIINGKKVVVK